MGSSFKDILDRHRGVGPGFDILRILLAVVILYGHAKGAAGSAIAHHLATEGLNASAGVAPLAHQASDVLAVGGDVWDGPKRPYHAALVPMFFALSGFLVTGSATRLRSIKTFLAFRGLRIFPALVVETVLSALLLGVFFTTLPLADYFTHRQFFRYFGNIFGFVTFTLPGVFANNPIRDMVNTNLWTLPAEFDCYLITALLMFTTLLYRRMTLTIIFCLATVAFIALNAFTQFGVTPTVLAPYTITYYFFAGVILFHWRDRVPYNWPLFLFAAVMSYALLYGRHTVYLAAPFVTYSTMFIGMTNLPKSKLLSSGDYSYGIYLYGFPITQALVAALPILRGHGWWTVFSSLSVTILFAVLSWHLIEKPALALKRHLPQRYFPTKPATAIPTPALRAEA